MPKGRQGTGTERRHGRCRSAGKESAWQEETGARRGRGVGRSARCPGQDMWRAGQRPRPWDVARGNRKAPLTEEADQRRAVIEMCELYCLVRRSTSIPVTI